jgi:hypothetical protein
LIEAARLAAVSSEVAPARYSVPRVGDEATASKTRRTAGALDADRIEKRSPGGETPGTM